MFNSAAKYRGVSLNSCLLSGPDTNNKLRDVLTRFREEKISFVADIESMFHAFHVIPEHRNYLRFYWFKNNDPSEKIVVHRAKVHVFGNTSSPAVATTCLRRAVCEPCNDPEYAPHVKAAQEYVLSHFYCDDGLGTAPSVETAIGILKTSRYLLSRYNIRLHKIVSNSSELLAAFPESEKACPDQISLSDHPTHRTLGLAWDIKTDSFLIKVKVPDRPFTRRGILSVVNSIYDIVGFASPVVLGGRLFLRKILSAMSNSSSDSLGWDETLPEDQRQYWESWLSGLGELDCLSIPRCFLPPNDDDSSVVQSLHIFSDASQEAIAHVTYLQTISSSGTVHVAFVKGESRVAPKAATTIPRLELCAAVEAAVSSLQTIQELKNKPASIHFYSDCKVVLAYLLNETKRFTRYVQRIIDIILNVSAPTQWNYIDSANNPADVATHPLEPKRLLQTKWLSGPDVLHSNTPLTPSSCSIELDNLPEVDHSDVATVLLVAPLKYRQVFSTTFQKYNSWTKLLRVASLVVNFCKQLASQSTNHRNYNFIHKDSKILAHDLLIHDAQVSAFSELVGPTADMKQLGPRHRLSNLAPFKDPTGLLRVGGRLEISALPEEIKHPLLLPMEHPVTQAVLQHHHILTKHQGRTITYSAVRQAGYMIERGRRVVRKLLEKCVTCRRLRASCETPMMSSLPEERTTPAPPFTAVGLDVFGHWFVRHGHRTRRSTGLQKCWAVLFTCLASRAVHIECIPSLDTPTFINAFKRFTALRGPCSTVLSDQGSNFIGTVNQLESVKVSEVSRILLDLGVSWKMNPPHASHFGGVWERKIGQIRRGLDASLLHAGQHTLSYDELNTLLQEASSIVNSTPLWETSFDPNDPIPITPNMLLTQKIGPPQPHTELDPQKTATYGPKRWRHVQLLADFFWSSWRKNYLQELQSRSKWKVKVNPLQCGDIVLIRDKHCSRLSWPVGIIETVHISHDNVPRSATIRMSKKSIEHNKTRNLSRPLSELVLLHRPV